MTLRDKYGRPLLNLRVSVANECNYRCIFCHLEGSPLKGPLPISRISKSRYLGPEDYSIIAEAASRIGITKVKLTGGEPLVRPDIVEIIRSFREYGSFTDISMTTNGYRLKEYAVKLREAGLDRINISLHSLHEERYRFITGVPGLPYVLQALDAVLDADYSSIKVNVVVMRGVNDDEIADFIDFAAEKGFVLQLIELHPVGLGKNVFQKYYLPLDKIEDYLKERSIKILVRNDLHNRPIYVLDNGVVVEVVRPYGNWRFCMGCTRIRLSPEGFLYPCINWRGPRISIYGILRSSASREEKVSLVINALRKTNSMREPYFKPPQTIFSRLFSSRTTRDSASRP